MYRARYINKLEQFGRTSYTLILEDLEGDMPMVRIEKDFPYKSSQMDDEMLYQDSSLEIQTANQAYIDYVAAQDALAVQIAADEAAQNGDQ